MKKVSAIKKKKATRILLIISLTILLAAGLYVLYILNIIPHKSYTNEDFGIADYISAVDKDGDGIDDQSDVLQNVRAYIATEPKYKSRYYGTGYPDDGYGVCTDVVAQGLLHAGYDLMTLVNEDILAHSDMYDIDKPDPNIDFRRVRNLIVYFRNHGISLTTDISDIDDWQGGDIIIFKKHIGIVSDKRNKNGVPFIIHHANPYQVHYEEDILENRNDIVGHFRIS